MKRLREDDDASEGYSNACEDDSVASLSKKQKQKLKQKQRKAAAELEQLPKGVIVYTQDTIPWDLQKYWAQRYSLFSKFDENVWLTDDGWFSVTPERVAKKITEHMLPQSSPSDQIIVDGFCGLGGNAIQFALSPKCAKVIAIDNDASMLACARHNAQIYGVEDKIEFVEADFFKFVKEGRQETINSVFLSPPWGGPGYKHDEVFDLDTMYPHSGNKIFVAAKLLSENVALFLPRNSDLFQLAKLVPDEEKIEAVHYCLKSRSKALCAYFGKY